MKARSPVKTPQSRARTRPARPVGADCNIWPIYSSSLNGCVERDLAGRLLFVEREEMPECGFPTPDANRREIGYREALAFITKHSLWKHSWKVLAHQGIKRLSAA